MQKFTDWAALQEDLDPAAAPAETPASAMSGTNLRYDLNKISTNTGERDAFAKAYPNLYREMNKLSGEAKMELHNLISTVMQQSVSWGRTTARKFKNA